MRRCVVAVKGLIGRCETSGGVKEQMV